MKAQRVRAIDPERPAPVKTLDYSEGDILADQPLKDAQSLSLPIGTALSTALASDPRQRPDAVGFWRQLA